MTKEFYSILGKYMVENPSAVNPFNFLEVLGTDEIEKIIRAGKGRLVEFFNVVDKDNDSIPDLIIPFQEGEPMKGFEPPFENWSILEEDEE